MPNYWCKDDLSEGSSARVWMQRTRGGSSHGRKGRARAAPGTRPKVGSRCQEHGAIISVPVVAGGSTGETMGLFAVHSVQRKVAKHVKKFELEDE